MYSSNTKHESNRPCKHWSRQAVERLACRSTSLSSIYLDECDLSTWVLNLPKKKDWIIFFVSFGERSIDRHLNREYVREIYYIFWQICSFSLKFCDTWNVKLFWLKKFSNISKEFHRHALSYTTWNCSFCYMAYKLSKTIWTLTVVNAKMVGWINSAPGDI